MSWSIGSSSGNGCNSNSSSGSSSGGSGITSGNSSDDAVANIRGNISHRSAKAVEIAVLVIFAKIAMVGTT